MANLERLYTIPLRKEFLKAPRYKRSKKVISTIRTFISKNMKNPTVKIGSMLNEEVLKHGRKNPPHKIRVKAIRYDEPSFVKVDLPNAVFEDPLKEKGKKEKKKEKEELKEEDIEKKEVLEHAKLEHHPEEKIKIEKGKKPSRKEKVISETGKR